VTRPELPPVLEVLPHRSPVLLLEQLVEHDARATSARVTAGGAAWMRRVDGSVPSWLALEYMAQCVAAHEGLLARDEGRPLPRGFLVGARGLLLHTASLGAGQRLRVSVRRVRGRPGLGVLSHTCWLHQERSGRREGELLAEGRLSVALAPSERARLGRP
jgi:predicted hotdog family 3-hydroxylacyl-ACP dehydratase